jgi:hypothetical protein
LKKLGYSVCHIHQIGKGCPDIMVGWGGVTYLVEIKNDGGKLTPDEEAWHKNWRGDVIIAYNTEDIIKHIEEKIMEGL